MLGANRKPSSAAAQLSLVALVCQPLKHARIEVLSRALLQHGQRLIKLHARDKPRQQRARKLAGQSGGTQAVTVLVVKVGKNATAENAA